MTTEWILDNLISQKYGSASEAIIGEGFVGAWPNSNWTFITMELRKINVWIVRTESPGHKSASSHRSRITILHSIRSSFSRNSGNTVCIRWICNSTSTDPDTISALCLSRKEVILSLKRISILVSNHREESFQYGDQWKYAGLLLILSLCTTYLICFSRGP